MTTTLGSCSSLHSRGHFYDTGPGGQAGSRPVYCKSFARCIPSRACSLRQAAIVPVTGSHCLATWPASLLGAGLAAVPELLSASSVIVPSSAFLYLRDQLAGVGFMAATVCVRPRPAGPLLVTFPVSQPLQGTVLCIVGVQLHPSPAATLQMPLAIAPVSGEPHRLSLVADVSPQACLPIQTLPLLSV